jgi:hypothetical protein
MSCPIVPLEPLNPVCAMIRAILKPSYGEWEIRFVSGLFEIDGPFRLCVAWNISVPKAFR